jgi:hypothetical protein
LRIARPAWEEKRAQGGENALKGLVRDAFALIDELGSTLASKGGISHKVARSSLRAVSSGLAADDSEIFKLDAKGRASVLEATAVAAGSIRDSGRRVVAVADIGGGTSDFGAFMTGLPNRNVLAEIKGSSGILREAGDYIDMQLRVIRRAILTP